MYHPHRDLRFEYADDAIRHIEQYNCRLGCIYGSDDDLDSPGGCCDTLLKILLEEDVLEIIDEGYKLHCTRRVPID